MTDILARIVAETKRTLRAERLDLTARVERPPHRFAEALRGGRSGRARVIAEIKAASPSAGTIVENPDVEAIAAAYRQGGAAAISVVTEPQFFRGSRDWIGRAATGSGLPVVMKDFVIDPVQIERAVAAGADAILLIAAILEGHRLRDFVSRVHDRGRDALVEVHDEEELDRAIAAGARIIGVNNRNLRDFRIDLATSEQLVTRMPGDVIRVTESGIRSRDDVTRLRRAGFDALLVGESLLRESDRAAAVRRLAGTPLVKICGITRAADAIAAADAGASFLGFVFVASSKRAIAVERAKEIAAAVRERAHPPRLVGVFRDEAPPAMNAIAEEAGLDLLQLHGAEPPGILGELARPAIKALPVSTEIPETSAWAAAEWILFDAAVDGAWGGLGASFDWTLLESRRGGRNIMLAGGLTPENVARAIEAARPDAIDVSSGVEETPGVKSAEKIRRLFEEVGR